MGWALSIGYIIQRSFCRSVCLPEQWAWYAALQSSRACAGVTCSAAGQSAVLYNNK